ncbi:MAG: D-hexose-6-phosphate mutarotase [Arenimonas sp.]|nr:D-hexose-6-phosphate mutarotase [Arenimonas sp.]
MSPPDLPVFTLVNAFGQITVAEYGGQLLSWKTGDGVEQLYTPEPLRMYPERALRGGVPVCFPQFSGRGALPKHGLVRTRPWQLRAKTDSALILAIEDDAGTRAQWPYAFELMQTLVLDAGGLSMALDVHNRSALPMLFTAALHSYLRVDDVTRCVLHGLDGGEYEDAADGGRYKVQHGGLRIVGEVDRVFADAPRDLLLQREGMSDLRIEQGGFSDSVVWCPGPDIAAAFTDMPAEDWQRMLCVEAAAAARAVSVPAGGHWQGWQRLIPMP